MEDGNSPSVKEAEIYDPATNSFSVAGSAENGLMLAAHAAVGQGAIFWGGLEQAVQPGQNGQPGQLGWGLPLNAAQNQYNVAIAYTGSAFSTVVQNQTLQGYTLCPAFAGLSGGKLFMAGGEMVSGQQLAPATDAQIVDNLSGSATSVGSLRTARFAGTAAEIGTGDALVAGGNDDSGTPSQGNTPGTPSHDIPTAELWSAAQGAFTGQVNMLAPRTGAMAVRLKSGAVAVIGGASGATDSIMGTDGTPTPTIEVYSK
jgi:hypothetical protein